MVVLVLCVYVCCGRSVTRIVEMMMIEKKGDCTGIKKPKRRFKKKKGANVYIAAEGWGFGPVATADTIWYRMVFIYIMMEFNLSSINECLCINNQKHVVQGVYYPVDLSHTAGPFMIIVHHGYIWSA